MVVVPLAPAPAAALQTPSGLTLSVDTSVNEEDDTGPTTVNVTATFQGGMYTTESNFELVLLGSSTATSGTDYTALTNLPTITIPANQASGSADIDITPNDDRLIEGDETIGITADPGTLSLIVTGVYITIVDDDTVSDEITLSVDNGSVGEGDTSATAVKVTATVNEGAPLANLTVPLDSTLGGTAAGSGTDYTATGLPSTITILAGSVSGEATGLSIDPEQDSIDEGTSETITISGGTLSGFTINPVDILIVDDDTVSGQITLSVDNGSVGEGDTSATAVKVTATFGTAVTRTVDTVVPLDSTLGGTAAGSGTDYTATGLPSTITILAGSVSGEATGLSIDPEQDSIDEGTSETITISGGTLSGFTINPVDILIVDDDTVSDQITLSVDNGSVGEGDTSATAVKVTATFGTAVTRTVDTVVPLDSTLGGTATGSGTDYTATGLPSTITILAGSVSGEATGLSIDPEQDSIDEGTSETITISGGTLSGFTINPVDILITDDDTVSDQITLSVDNGSVGEGDTSATAVKVTATFGTAVTRTVDTVVPLDSTLGGTATGSGTDYTATGLPSTITILAGSVSGEATGLSIRPVDDRLIEGTSETITISGGTLSGFTINPVNILIVDDDTVSDEITLSVDNGSVGEGDTSATAVKVTATVNEGAPLANLTVPLDSTLGGTAAGSGTDYTATGLPSTITILAGSVSGEATGLSIDPEQDSIDEGTSETITISGGTLSGFTINPVNILITDDDTVSDQITLSVDNGSVGEGDTSATAVKVTATFGTAVTRTVDTVVPLDSTLGGTATGSGTDYTATGLPSTITILAGSVSGEATGLSIDPEQDSIDEGTSETITISGGTLSGFTINPVNILITDDDTVSDQITLSVDNGSVGEGDTSATAVKVTATFGTAVTRTVDTVVPLDSTLGGTATGSGTDYTATGLPSTITILAGSVSGEATGLSIDPEQDSIDEGTSETITISGGTLSGFTINPVDILITDDDTVSDQITLSVDNGSVGEGDTSATAVKVTATFGTAVTRTVDTVVPLDSTLGGTATGSGTDYTATGLPSTITILAGSVSGEATGLSIDPEQDSIDEGTSETITISGGTLSGFTINPVDILITDDDTVSDQITLSVDNGSVGEGDTSATAVKVTATFGTAVTRTVDTVVPLDSTLGGTATGSGTDYTATGLPSTITILAGSVSGEATGLSIDPEQDSIDEGTSETITISGGTLSGFTINPVDILIVDDDTVSGQITLSVDNGSVGEGDTSATAVKVTATFGTAVTRTVDTVVPLDSTLGGTAAGSGTDYTATGLPSTITILAGSVSGEATGLSIDPEQDSIDEGTSETITISGGTLSGFTINPVDILIVDDDTVSDQITLSVDNGSVGEGDTSATAVKVTATFGTAVTRTVDTVVPLDSTLGGTAAGSGTDYTATGLPSTITILAGSVSGEATGLSIDPEQDSIDEGTSETITISGGTLSGFTINPVDILITDDDTVSSTINLNVNTSSVDEGERTATTITVTATFSTAVTRTEDTEVDLVSTLGGTATSGTDYTATTLPGSVTIRAGRSTGTATSTFTITPVADRLIEDDETITISGTLGNFTVNDAEITIVDDDNASDQITLRVHPTELREVASATNITVTATLNDGAPSADVTVTLSVAAASTAIRDTDYTAPTALGDATADITITEGLVSGHTTITIDPTEDSIDEDNETIVISGSPSGELSTATVIPATFDIIDNDRASSIIDLSTQPSNIDEDGGAVDVTVVATLRGSVTRATDTVVTLDSTLRGTATSGTDYTATNVPTSVTIPAGSLSGSATSTFKIAPIDDDENEPHEGIWVTGNLDNFTVQRAEIILVDNDSVSSSLTLKAEVTAGSATFPENAGTPTTVRLTARLDGAVRSSDTVVRLVLGGTAEAGADYVVAPPLPQIIIPAGQVEGSTMVVIDPLDDSIDEGTSETIVISGTASGGLDVFDDRNANLALTITDDDTAPTAFTLTTDRSRVHEAGPNVTMQVTATLVGSTTLSTDTTVELSLHSSSSAEEDKDYRLSPDPPGNITIPAGAISGAKTIRVLPIQDSLSEVAEDIVINGSSTNFVDAVQTTITLTDDDSMPTSLSLSVNPSSIIESAGTRSVRVTADLDGSALTSDTTVTLSVDGSSTVENDDWTAPVELTDGTVDITIPAGQTRGSTTVRIELENDTIDEGVSETIVIGGDANNTLTVNGATLTIVDDDTVSDVIKLTVGDGKSIFEIDENAGTDQKIDVTATRGSEVTSAKDETVQLRLRGTADAGATQDYEVTRRDVVILAGQMSGSAEWTFDLPGDSNSEGTETIEIEGAAAGRLVQGVTIAVKDAGTNKVDVPERTELGDPTPVNSFRLNWDAPDSSNNINDTQPDGYRLQRRELGGLWHNVADIVADSEAETYSHVDRGPFEYSTTYQWRLVAYVVDQIGNRYDGVPSEFVEATTAGRPVASISNEDEPIRECNADPSQGTVILANGWSPADISTAAALAARIPGTIVLYANAARLPNHVRELLCSYQPSRIIVVGGTAALSNAVVNRAQDTVEGAQIDRLNGATRIHTAAAAARSALGNPAQTAQRTVFIANGWSAPDLGAAAAAAGRTANSAVLFTASDSLPEATRDVITDYLPSRIVIVGGTAAVSAAVAEAIAAANPAADVQRLEGATRVDTAAAAARRVLDTPGSASTPRTLIVANGWSPPDIGVAAAYAAGTSNSAVVFTEPDALPAAVRMLIAYYQPSRIVFIGGIATIPRNVSDAVAAAAPNARIERISGATRTHTAAAAAQRALGYALP